MLYRILSWSFLLVVVGGLLLHYHYEIPWIHSWFGMLPGDMVVWKGKTQIYLPVASSLLLGGGIGFILYLLKRS